MRLALFFLLLAAGPVLAQTPGLGDTRPLPPRSAPHDEPSPHASHPAARERSQSDAALSRCSRLSDELRQQCLREERNAGAGASRRAEPPSAPPPQNPR